MEKMELGLDFGKCMASIVTVTCFVLKRIRGRRIFNPYALFEALKVRDSKRLEPVQRYRHYDDSHKAFPKSYLFYTFSTVTALKIVSKFSMFIKPV